VHQRYSHITSIRFDSVNPDLYGLDDNRKPVFIRGDLFIGNETFLSEAEKRNALYRTQDLKSCRLVSRLVAVVYNWWTLFVHLAQPQKHSEAITSRPLLFCMAWPDKLCTPARPQ
jgi:hypothetical protein